MTERATGERGDPVGLRTPAPRRPLRMTKWNVLTADNHIVKILLCKTLRMGVQGHTRHGEARHAAQALVRAPPRLRHVHGQVAAWARLLCRGQNAISLSGWDGPLLQFAHKIDALMRLCRLLLTVRSWIISAERVKRLRSLCCIMHVLRVPC